MNNGVRLKRENHNVKNPRSITRGAKTHHTNQVNTENHYIRLQRDQHDALIEEYNDVLSISDVDGKPCNVKLLRPKPAPPTYIERLCEPHGEDGKVRGLQFVQAEKFEQLWQNAIQGHSKSEPTCTGTSSLTKTARDRPGSPRLTAMIQSFLKFGFLGN